MADNGQFRRLDRAELVRSEVERRAVHIKQIEEDVNDVHEVRRWGCVCVCVCVCIPVSWNQKKSEFKKSLYHFFARVMPQRMRRFHFRIFFRTF